MPGPTRPRACARGGHRGRTGGRPAVGRVARGCAPHDWRLGRPAGRCNREWEVPLGACKLPVGFPVGPRQVPLGARVGLSKRASKSEWEHGGSASVVPLGPSAFGEAPSPSPTRRREAHPACSHWEAAPLPCARHFLWGTFLRDVCLCPLRFVSQYKLLSSRRPVRSLER